MKRKAALLLSLALLLTMVFPLKAFAEEMDKGLENAIRTAKTKFTIPDDYKFSSSIYTSRSRQYMNLAGAARIPWTRQT